MRDPWRCVLCVDSGYCASVTVEEEGVTVILVTTACMGTWKVWFLLILTSMLLIMNEMCF